MSESTLYKIGITHGDFNGIGYEIIMKALNDSKLLDMFTPIVYGAPKAACFYKNLFELQDFSMQVSKKIDQINPKKNNLLSISDQDLKVEPGKPTPEAARLADLALTNACKDLKSKQLDALVTAPINPESIKSGNHAQFLSQQFSAQNAMLISITNGGRVAFAHNHLKLDGLAQKLSTELLVKRLKVLHQSLKVDFACTNPKIAVLAVNAKGGENGFSGKEDKEIVAPAIQQAFTERINAFGPFTIDTLFDSGDYAKFDAVMVLYYEQGQDWISKVAADNGCEYTAGLPIVHTAPGHGPMFESAGKNVADGLSMRNAIYLALDILQCRKDFLQYAKKLA